MSRARGSMLTEVVFAFTLAVAVASTAGSALVSQGAQLHVAQDEARARAALLAAHERLRAGTLAPPAPEERRTVGEAGGFTVTVERATGFDARLASEGALVPVTLEVRWKAHDGKDARRSLAALVAGGSR